MAAITICRSTRASATRRVSRDVAAARGRGKNLWSLDRNQSAGPHLKLGRGISRGAPSAAASANELQAKRKSIEFLTSPGEFSQRQMAKIPEKKGRFVSRRPKSTPDASFLHSLFHPFDAFPPAGRSSSIHAGTSGALQRSRCYGVRRRGAPPLRCVTNARSNPENSGARGSGRDLVAPRPARLLPSSL